MRLSKLDAATRLGISPSTVDRMIQRGQLDAEKEPHGTRYKIWVLLDDEPGDSPPDQPVDESRDEPPVANDEPGDSPVPPPDLSAQLEIATLRERAKSAEERAQTLEGLADYHKQLLTDSEWRFQEILQQLKQSQQNVAALTRALPAPTGEAPGEDPDATTIVVDPEPEPTPHRALALVAVRKAVTRRPAEMVQAGHIQTTNSLHNAGPLGRCEPALRNGIQAMTKFDSNDML